MRTALLPAAASQYGLFTAKQARAAGHDIDDIQRMVRIGQWRRLRRGVYAERELVDAVAGDDRESHLLAIEALRLVLPRPFTASSWSAVRVHGLATLTVPPPVVHGIDGGVARSGKGYEISASLLPAEHRDPRRPGVVTAARAVVDAARGTDFTAAVVMADSALHLGLATRAELTGAALACRYHEGVGTAARACWFADGGAESPLESQARVELVRLGLPSPRLQVSFYDDDGFIGRGDMYLEELGVVVEVDGRVKYSSPFPERDAGRLLWEEKRRMDRMEQANLGVVRVIHDEVTTAPRRIVDRVQAAAARVAGQPRRYRVRYPS